MGYDLKNTKQYHPINSIISGQEKGDDYLRPFIFTDWVQRLGNITVSQEALKEEYNKYVRLWKNLKEEKNDHGLKTKQRYISLLKNIALNYTTDEEKRFLTNIDFDKPRHVEATLNFYSQKIKQITAYISTERENIKYSTDKKKSTGSLKSIQTLIQSEIDHIINELSLKQGNVPTADELSKKVVKVVELYTTGHKIDKTYEIDFDINIYKDLTAAIDLCLEDCVPLLEISEELVLSVTSNIDRTQETIEQLDYEWFYNYIKKQENLNLHIESEYVQKLIGDDLYTSANNTPELLVEASAPWNDITSRGKPVINRLVPTGTESLYTLGSTNIPKNLGLLTYYSYAPVIDTIGTTTNVLNDVTKSYSNLSRESTDINVKYHEDITWLKADASNDGLFGDIVNAERMPKFFSYRSDEENHETCQVGISRSTDPLGFFTGEGGLDWANEDVFKRKIENIYPINERQAKLLIGHETVTKWATDIYGNEYALFKNVSPPRDPEQFAAGESIDDFVTDSICQTIDGGDTLKPRAPLWTKGVQYKIYEGGRRGGIDPKIEQRLNMAEFEDLRRYTTILDDDGTPVQALEPHNSYYLAPNARHTEMVITRITFHGFRFEEEQPVYDQQAYCGLFTDETCGRIDASGRECRIRDNYAFGTFSDLRETVDEHALAVNQQNTIRVYTTDVGADKSQWSIVVNPGQSTESISFQDGVFTANFTQDAIDGSDLVRLLNTRSEIWAVGGETTQPATIASDNHVFWLEAGGYSADVRIAAPTPGFKDITMQGDDIKTIKQMIEAEGLTVTSKFTDTLDDIVNASETYRFTGGTDEVTAIDQITQTTTISFSGGENTYYVSSTQTLTSQTDAYEEYINIDFSNEIGDDAYMTFDGNSPLTSVTVWESEDIDGSRFGDDLCEPGDAEYITNESRISEYYDYRDNVSRTRYSEVNEDALQKELTQYQSRFDSNGRVVFRSGDSYIIEDILNVLSESLVQIGTPEYKKYDREIIREQLQNNQIRDMDVFHDVIVINTDTHIYAEKIIYESADRKLVRTPYPPLTIKATTDDNQLETAFRNYHNQYDNLLVCGHTRKVEINEKQWPQPIVIVMDLNDMTTRSMIIPESELTLSGELSGYDITSIDTPIVTYDEFVQIYTLSYSCRIAKNEKISYGVCVFDFEDSSQGLRILTSNVYHTSPVDFRPSALDPWEEKITSKTINFPKTMPIPASMDTTYTLDMKNVFGETFNQYTLDLTIDPRTIPVDSNGAKINRIVFDPGDGANKVYRSRELQTGLEPINFDISDLPDQSDFADPRILPFNHVYNFQNSDITQYVATLEVTYSNFRKLTISIVIDTIPYTTQSAFDDVKLIDSKTFTDKMGKFRQVLTLETQNPRTVADVCLLKEMYTNSNVIGYLDGNRYAGPNHTMSDGTLMTGNIHTPDSRVIIPI